MATQNNAISIGNNILVDTNLDLYANNITFRSISYRGFIGTNAGYSFGGANSGATTSPPNPALAPPAPPFTLRSEIDRYPFASESTISNAGALSANRGNLTGHSSSTHAYSAGGITNFSTPPFSPAGTTLDRFPFTTPFVTASSVGSLSSSRATAAGISGDNFGFVVSGRIPDSATNTSAIDRFPFASSPVNASAVGTELTSHFSYLAGLNSGKDGYIAGGSSTASTFGITNVISKFPYINPVRTTNVGVLTVNKLGCGGVSGITDGYVIGGNIAPAPITYTNVIDRFPFVTEITNAFNTGTLSATKSFMSTQSSDTFGYSLGGTNSAPNFIPTPGGASNAQAPYYGALGPASSAPLPATNGLGFISQSTTLERFPYASGTVTGASVGTLTTGKWGCAGAQY
jgi:hypothetical protein